MKFTKMQGIGNDYVYVNCFTQQVADPQRVARLVSDRRFGIGSDGLILIKPSSRADCEMDMYNADGSRGKMCGNGIRCVGKYVYDRGLCRQNPLTVDTASGVKTLRLTVENGQVQSVRVDMGAPILYPPDIPATFPGQRAVDVPLTVDGKEYRVTAVSMGNPHCVLFVDDVDALDLEKIGPAFEHHPAFPERVNTEFVQLQGPGEGKMRVWERGSGETWACGTGACASVAACVLNGKTGPDVLLHLKGGDLRIHWQPGESLFMEGPAAFVFDGEIDI